MYDPDWVSIERVAAYRAIRADPAEDIFVLLVTEHS